MNLGDGCGEQRPKLVKFRGRRRHQQQLCPCLGWYLAEQAARVLADERRSHVLAGRAQLAAEPRLTDARKEWNEHLEHQLSRREQDSRAFQQALRLRCIEGRNGLHEFMQELTGRLCVTGRDRARTTREPLELGLPERRDLPDGMTAIDRSLQQPQPVDLRVRIKTCTAFTATGRWHTIAALPDAQRVGRYARQASDGADAVASLRHGA